MKPTIHGQKMCRHTQSSVVESRDEGHQNSRYADFPYIKFRRRKCLSCGHRFVTFEVTMDHLDKWSDGIIEQKDNIVAQLRKVLESQNEQSLRIEQ